MREDQEKNEKRVAKAKQQQDRKIAAERGEAMMADEERDTEKEVAVKTTVPVAIEKDDS